MKSLSVCFAAIRDSSRRSRTNVTLWFRELLDRWKRYWKSEDSPDIVDAHVYGGALIATVGLAMWVHWSVGMLGMGTFLAYLGLRRKR